MSKKTVALATIVMLGSLGLDAASSQTGTDPYGTTGTSQAGTATDPATTPADPAMDPATDPAMTSDTALPETASLWPLVGLLGLGSVGVGLVLRRRR